MSARTKIFVFKLKELIYTVFFLLLLVLFIIFFIAMFQKSPSVSAYQPGIYRSTLCLGNDSLEVSVIVDAQRVQSIEYYPLSDTLQTSYPLLTQITTDLASQMLSKQSIQDLTPHKEATLTSQAIIQTIDRALKKALP